MNISFYCNPTQGGWTYNHIHLSLDLSQLDQHANSGKKKKNKTLEKITLL